MSGVPDREDRLSQNKKKNNLFLSFILTQRYDCWFYGRGKLITRIVTSINVEDFTLRSRRSRTRSESVLKSGAVLENGASRPRRSRARSLLFLQNGFLLEPQTVWNLSICLSVTPICLELLSVWSACLSGAPVCLECLSVWSACLAGVTVCL